MNQPWIEKYRPNCLNDIVLSNTNRELIQNMIDKNYYPNTLFYGPPGTGKTTTILCLMDEYKKKHKCNKNYIHLNASHERGIEVIRNHIAQFADCSTFFEDHHKFVILDEMDSLTKQAQKQLFKVMKSSSKHRITFILICNYLNKVLPYIQESLIILYFNKTSFRCDDFIQQCLTQENIHIDQKDIDDIKKQYTHDLRSILNSLQNFQKKDITLSNSTCNSLMTNKNYISLYNKLTSIYDPFSLLSFFFMYLYESYDLDKDTIETMRSIIFHHDEENYFIDIFLPQIRKQYIKN
uniref:AAA+ ATPase domain-containing protein n=1 Tax=viral metagenome TaxID=1070528 RepID=A0A6C0KKT3_9ZZZZ